MYVKNQFKNQQQFQDKLHEDRISQQKIRRLNIQLKEQRQNQEKLNDIQKQQELYAQKRAKQQKQDEYNYKQQHKHERFIKQRARRIYEQKLQNNKQQLEAKEAKTQYNIHMIQQYTDAIIQAEKTKQFERLQRARDFKKNLLEQDFEVRNYIFNQEKKDIYNYIKGQINVMLRAEEQKKVHDQRIQQIIQNKNARQALIRDEKIKKLQEKEAKLIETFMKSPDRNLDRINSDRCIRSASYLRKSLHGAYEPIRNHELADLQ